MEELKLNQKLFDFKGYIGRRDFFTNIIMILIIGALVNIFYSNYIRTAGAAFSFASMELFLESIKNFYVNTPILLKLWVVITNVTLGIVFISNAIRRLNDINGIKKPKYNITFASLVGIQLFLTYIPYFIKDTAIVFSILSILLINIIFIASLILLFKIGKITGDLPYDSTKEFNWGACLGTWIWGLINRSYITLLGIILFFTPANIYFMIYCGLKGNEWALKNREWDSMEKFEKSQKKQTIVFLILNFVVLPIVYFIFIIFISAVIAMLGFSALSDDENKANTQSKLDKFEQSIDKLLLSYTEDYKITKNQNSFYVNPKLWKDMDYQSKMKLLENLASYAARYKEKQLPAGSIEFYDKYSELPKTKIYSSTNHELLAEYVDPKMDKSNFKNSLKSVLNSFKFYEPTTK